ncbi:MAG: hypothetical protein K0R84_2839 [Clostridia bacterium]|jgi:hypothetical protein|nr:hypothetical protein [Clostridia bacterium]
MILNVFLSISLMLNVPIKPDTSHILPPPKIVKFYTSIAEKDGWVNVTKDTQEITFYVEAQNTDTVLFWLMPTGTGPDAYNQRKLIGYDINDDGDNKFSLTWKIPEPLLDHLQVQALGLEEIANEWLSIYSLP